MFATHSLRDARHRLDNAISARLWSSPLAEPVERIRYPIGLFFIRGDRGGKAKDLAEQVVASYDYWNTDSGKYLDMVFPGWGKDGDVIDFNLEAFMHCKSEVEGMSKWRYSGETDILLLNYDYTITHWNSPQSFVGKGRFAFDEAIILPLEVMVRDGRVGSLDGFMQELINSAKKHEHRSEKSILWEIRDKVALDRSRTALWEAVKKYFLKDFSKIYDELRPFVVCDLRTSRACGK